MRGPIRAHLARVCPKGRTRRGATAISSSTSARSASSTTRTSTSADAARRAYAPSASCRSRRRWKASRFSARSASHQGTAWSSGARRRRLNAWPSRKKRRRLPRRLPGIESTFSPRNATARSDSSSGVRAREPKVRTPRQPKSRGDGHGTGQTPWTFPRVGRRNTPP